MRTDILDLHRFYLSPLGRRARAIIVARLREVWSAQKGMRMAGFGYVGPYLEAFGDATHRINLAPATQGVSAWPQASHNSACLMAEAHWPLADASIDHLLVMHGLEEARDPHKILREAWRVLAPSGDLVIAVAQRRSPWTFIDNSPWAAGRPFSKSQLTKLLGEGSFSIIGWSGALFFPPVDVEFLLKLAPSWERAGAAAWPGLGGLLLVQARKEVYAPIEAGATSRLAVQRPIASRAPSGSTRLQQKGNSVRR